MRRAAATLSMTAVVTALLGAALPGPAMASASSPVGHQPAVRGTATVASAAVTAPKGCDQQPKKQPTAKQIPWAQQVFKTERVWPISTGQGVTVAVIDSGVNADHAQLKNANIANGADFLRSNGGRSGLLDCMGHGTAVASLIAAQKVSNVGFRGLAYGARILPIAVSEDPGGEQTDKAGATSPEKLAKAIDYAVSQNAQVINISVVVYQESDAVTRAVQNAVDNDAIVVAAAGSQADAEKNKPGPKPYPASHADVIGVAAVDVNMARWENSQWGEQVDLAAPGVDVIAANLGGGHVSARGTTVATGFVSASAALVRSKWPDLSAKEVARRLYATASPASGSHQKVGYGVVDPYRALTEELSDDEPVEPAAAQVPSPDPAAVARDREWGLKGVIALSVAGVGVVLAGVMLATLTLLPLGKRRRWRPGRAKPYPEPAEDDIPPAPAKLFDNLETP